LHNAERDDVAALLENARAEFGCSPRTNVADAEYNRADRSDMPNIYLLQENGGAVELSEQPYDSEEILQRLLAEHPNVLGGDQIGGTRPRRWLLVTREAGIPFTETAFGRWPVDHLFVDQDGTPTLVK
jgi:hypothetical protein